MLALLAIICTGGVKAAVGDTYKLVTSVDELKAGDVIVIGCSANQRALGTEAKKSKFLGVAVSISNGVLTYTDKLAEFEIEIPNDNQYFFKNSDGKYLLSKADSKLTLDDKDDAYYATISINANKNATICYPKTNKKYYIKYNTSGNYFSFYAETVGNQVQIYKKQDSGKTSTTTTFGAGYDNKTFTFVGGVLKDFKAPIAQCTTEGVTGTIAYSSSDTEIVTVDAKGALTFTNTKFGTATITATFTPNDKDKYAVSTATYTVINTQLYNGIADFKKAITGESEEDALVATLNLTDAVVTYVKGQNVFIQDATAGIFIFGVDGFAVGDKFTGKVVVKAYKYIGLNEICSWTAAADMVKTTGADIPVKEVTLAELQDDAYESMRVKVVGVTATTAFVSRKATLKQGDATLQIYDKVNALKITANSDYDIIGYPGINKTTRQLTVWEQSDITEHQEADKADPEIAFKETEKTVELKEEMIELSTLINNPHTLPVTYTSSNDEVAEVSEGVIYMYKTGKVDIIAKFAGDDTYNAVEKTLALTIEDSREGVKSIVEITSQEDYTTELKIQKENVTLKCSDGNLKNSTEFRLYGSSNTTISVTSGQIVKIELTGKIKNSIGLDKLTPTPGVYEVATDKKSAVWTGEAASVVFRNTASSQVQVTSIKVYIKETKVPVVLDENDNSNTFEENKDVNVTIKRTFYKDGDWNTLCLPFDVSAEKVKAAFGSDAQLRQVDEAHSKDNTVAFTTATAIKAGVPYLIKFDKLAENADQPQEFNHTFEGVTLTKKVEYSVLADFNIIFTGSYSAFTPEDFLKEYNTCDVVASMAAANTLKKVYAGTTIKGLRAVFGLASSVQPQAVKVVIDGTTTGIGDLHVDGASVANGRVYNLNGQCVGTSLEGLKAGVYIQNGKKVIINK